MTLDLNSSYSCFNSRLICCLTLNCILIRYTESCELLLFLKDKPLIRSKRLLSIIRITWLLKCLMISNKKLMIYWEALRNLRDAWGASLGTLIALE